MAIRNPRKFQKSIICTDSITADASIPNEIGIDRLRQIIIKNNYYLGKRGITMAQLWGGRFTKETDQLVYNFNASISFDQKFYKQDIQG